MTNLKSNSIEKFKFTNKKIVRKLMKHVYI